MKDLGLIFEGIFDTGSNTLTGVIDDVYINKIMNVNEFDKAWPIVCDIFGLTLTNNVNQRLKSVVLVANLQYLSSQIKTENHFPQTSVYAVFLIKNISFKSCDVYRLFLSARNAKPVLEIENYYYLNTSENSVVLAAKGLIDKFKQVSIPVRIYKLTQDNAIKLANHLKLKI